MAVQAVIMIALVLLYVEVWAQPQTFEVNGLLDSEPDYPRFTFSYKGHDWSGICSSGRSQSPIDIVASTQLQVVSQANSSFTPLLVTLETVTRSEIYVQNVQGLLAYFTAANSVTQYLYNFPISMRVMEYHPIVPAEHLLNGIQYPLGLVVITGISHFDNSIQAFQCLEILFKIGKSNPFLQSLIEETGEVSLSSLFPPSGVIGDYYYYSGSVDLPWPDCWEPVTWYIPNYIVEASSAQIDYWSERYVQNLSFSNGRGSARDIQPLNNRTLYHFIAS